jgi:dienelactone hydrolase
MGTVLWGARRTRCSSCRGRMPYPPGHGNLARSASVGLALWMLVGCASATPLATLAHAPTGRIPFFTSRNVTASELASAVPPGTTATIHGDLTLPAGEARVPAVILLHGGSGISGIERGWSRELRRFGYASFVIDSFSGRGVGEFPSEEQLTRASGILDAYRALQLLTTHPRIDPARIALMGFSRGGGPTLWASMTRFRRTHLPEDTDFAAYLAFYPARGPLGGDSDVSKRPIRIFHGTADGAVPITIPRRYVEQLRAAGADARLFEYEGALHAFDNPEATPPSFVPHPVRGFYVGHDPRAHARAIEDVKATLEQAFSQP